MLFQYVPNPATITLSLLRHGRYIGGMSVD
jgi:hypothetical protein